MTALKKWSKQTSKQERRRSIWGVSIVVCSHNGGGRLPAALVHLAVQQVPPGLPWEVVVVDNASTDDTAAVAKANWPADAPSPLRVVHERELGLTQARCRGVDEAQYELISFVDDDNWVAPDWVSVAARVMARLQDVGACGGRVQAQCEHTPPQWFDRCLQYYAVGSQGAREGDVTWSRGYLWGAGLTVRKSAWRELTRRGFLFQLTDREGSAVTSGGDAELCLALRLAGWKLWYEPALTLRHFISAGRMQWDHLQRLAQGFGTAAVVLNAYATVRHVGSSGGLLWMRSNWLCQTAVTMLRLISACGRCLLGLPKWEGNEAVLDVIYRSGALRQFLRTRSDYDSLCRRVQQMFRAGRDSNSSTLVEVC
jgi:glycosyltransferase involved in cell wall biosynthesis